MLAANVVQKSQKNSFYGVQSPRPQTVLRLMQADKAEIDEDKYLNSRFLLLSPNLITR